MSQAATFGRRAPLAGAASSSPARRVAPAAQPSQQVRAWEPSPPAVAVGFDTTDTELDAWKAQRRARIWAMLGNWRWFGTASGAGALALLLSGYDPGHLAGPLAGCSAMFWLRAFSHYRRALKFAAEQA
jgi:hypothetical protein